MTEIPDAVAAAPNAKSSSELLNLSASDAVLHITRVEMTAESYASALLARCESVRALNAFITLEPALVLESARNADRQRRAGANLGPLFGLPIPIKDSVNTRDYPTTAGTPALRRFRPAQDAPVVQALRDAGAIVLAKTNLHELSYGRTSNNLAFGAVHNPYDVKRIPGGSSGGTAAAIARQRAGIQPAVAHRSRRCSIRLLPMTGDRCAPRRSKACASASCATIGSQASTMRSHRSTSSVPGSPRSCFPRR